MKIRFILNPKSGKTLADTGYIKGSVLVHFPEADFCETEGPAHATELALQATKQGFDVVVAIGGDGTINEVARGLVNTNTALGIIPHGSGNGLHVNWGLWGPCLKYSKNLKGRSYNRVM